MEIPLDINTRAEAMWRIISQQVNFKKKSVIDLGCGHGEMLWRAYVAGAETVWGVDGKKGLLKRLGRVYTDYTKKHIQASPLDLNNHDDLYLISHQDINIAMCFSVLPYLDDIPATLQWMADNFELCLIEAQYEPEPYNIGVKNDEEMFSFLRDNGFEIAVNLGKTYVEIRDTHRTIWACSAKRIRY
jgi:hypothetical protein